jgi:hypothetical protein
MPRSTLFHVFRPVNSANPNSFHVVPISRSASDGTGFAAPMHPRRCVGSRNNIGPGGLNENKEEAYEVVGDYREKVNGQQLGASGRVEENVRQPTAEKATEPRGWIHSLVARFFNWHHEVKSHSNHNSPPKSSAVESSQNHPPKLIAAAPQSFTASPASRLRKFGAIPSTPVQSAICATETTAPASSSLEEICMGVQARLANCKYDGILDLGSGHEPLILFTPWSGPSKGSTLALPKEHFDAAHIRERVRDSDARFDGVR